MALCTQSARIEGIMQNEVRKMYQKVQKLLISLIPENWKSIYLYASVINDKGGEMYFYYLPKKIIKTKPINCYEIPDRFGINENTYNNSLGKLYNYLKALREISRPKWTNATIVIENNIFTIEFHYNDLEHSKYNDEQRRTVWCYKYLGIPIESMNLSDRLLIEGYKEESKIKPIIHTEKIENGNKEDMQTNEDKSKEILTDEQNIIRNPFLKF